MLCRFSSSSFACAVRYGCVIGRTSLYHFRVHCGRPRIVIRGGCVMISSTSPSTRPLPSTFRWHRCWRGNGSFGGLFIGGRCFGVARSFDCRLFGLLRFCICNLLIRCLLLNERKNPPSGLLRSALPFRLFAASARSFSRCSLCSFSF